MAERKRKKWGFEVRAEGRQGETDGVGVKGEMIT